LAYIRVTQVYISKRQKKSKTVLKDIATLYFAGVVGYHVSIIMPQ